MQNNCRLILNDAFSLPGISFGAPAPSVDEVEERAGDLAPRSVGEAVFVTAMSGYHELLTDPSYTGQIVVMTYPHAGNYGCDECWNESVESDARPTVSPAGLVVRNLYTGPVPDGRETLDEFLKRHSTPGITNVDTRRLTLHLRDGGARNGLIVRCNAGELTEEELKRVAAVLTDFPSMLGRDLLGDVGVAGPAELNPEGSPHIALLDCGAKRNILRLLVAAGCHLTVLPADTDKEQLDDVGADALFVSNGPGDPAVLPGQVSLIRETIGSIPVLGICLGHQLVAQALGATTFKMSFGHHGLNHPVRDRRTGKVFVTSQNHGFAVDGSNLPAGCEVWFDNANDGTVEGLIHDGLRVRTTQFHPEAAPGPRDAQWLFESFLDVVNGGDRAGTH